MNPLRVLTQVVDADHADVAQGARVRPDALVHVQVVLVLVVANVLLRALGTLVDLLLVRCYPVDGQQVLLHAPLGADDLPAVLALKLNSLG